MSGPIAGVSPNSNGWLGGSYSTSSPPTNVGGALATPGAASFPGPRAPPISEARNDRGTNITIPYARVVPNQWSDAPPDATTKLFSNSRAEKLVAGTIAFIWQGVQPNGTRSNLTDAPAHARMLDRGHDVNRQQLLCTMDWLNTTTINKKIPKDLYKAVDDALATTAETAAKEAATKAEADAEREAAEKTKKETAAKEAKEAAKVAAEEVNQATKSLENRLRREGLFEWVVDGVVLSKLESPSGQPLASEELDLAQGSLYNLAVAGPAICSEGIYETVVGNKKNEKGENVFAIVDRKANHHAWLPLDILYVGLFADEKDDDLIKLRWNVIGSQEMYEKVYKPDLTTRLLGAYQIGKILDSAAARQRVTSGIRRTPGGAAVNLNVALSWVSTNQLKIQYDLITKMRDQPAAEAAATAPP